MNLSKHVRAQLGTLALVNSVKEVNNDQQRKSAMYCYSNVG